MGAQKNFNCRLLCGIYKKFIDLRLSNQMIVDGFYQTVTVVMGVTGCAVY